MDPDGGDFARWYDEECERLVRVLTVLTGDLEGAREAVAEAFTQAFAKWSRVGPMEARTGWVYRVAQNRMKRVARRRSLEARLLRGDRPANTQLVVEDRSLWAAVEALPQRQREAILLRYVADLREREVAAAMRISEGAASAALSVARRSLARALADSRQETR